MSNHDKPVVLMSITKDELSDHVKDAVLSVSAIQQDTDKFVTRKKACDLLSISLTTLDTWVIAGKISAYKIDKVVRFKESEVLGLFEKYQKLID